MEILQVHTWYPITKHSTSADVLQTNQTTNEFYRELEPGKDKHLCDKISPVGYRSTEPGALKGEKSGGLWVMGYGLWG
jgi:hypothetical protein